MFQQVINDIIGGTVPESEREAKARSLAEKCGYASAALTIIPLPGTEIIGVMPIHIGMVIGIGQVYGQEVTQETAIELIFQIGTTVGVSLVSSRLATTVGKVFLPGLGGLIGAPFMYASTIAIATVARMHFEGVELSKEELRKVYKDKVKQAKRDFSADRMRSDEAKDMAKAAVNQADAAPEQAAPDEAPAAEAAPSPAPQGPVARLKRLKALLDEGLIDQGEYDAVKARVLAEI